MIDKKLLEILVCPVCKKKLIENKNKLICRNCDKEYMIIDDIPVLLSDQARANS